MKKNVMGKNLSQTILRSITRYIAIVLIIALGAAIFVGLRTTKTDMIHTGQEFMDGSNMFDLRLLSSYGWSKENLEQIKAIDGVVDAEGVMSLDVLARFDGRDEAVYKLYDIPETVTKPLLQGGRMPENEYECLVDGARFGDDALGTQIVLSEKNDEDTLDSLVYHTFTVVGYVSTPLYMDMSRGTTTLGNGTVSAYVYIPKAAFDMDYYTEIDITMDCDHTIYTEAFHNAMDDMADYIKPLLEPIALERFKEVRSEAEVEYNDGMAEYLDAYQQYLDGRKEAFEGFADAEKELEDGQAEIDENRAMLEDALAEIAKGQTEIDENLLILMESSQQLALSKSSAYAQIAAANDQLMSNYKIVTENLALVEDGILQIESAQDQLILGIVAMELAVSQMDTSLMLTESMLSILEISLYTAQNALDQAKENGSVDAQTLAELEANLADLEAKKTQYEDQYDSLCREQENYAQQLADLYKTRDELEAQYAELLETRETLTQAMTDIENGRLELESSEASMNHQLASAEAQIEAGQLQLDAAQRELDAARDAAQAGILELEEAQLKLNEGWAEFRAARDETLRQLSEAELQLLAAKYELDQAGALIAELESPTVYALGRNVNMSYISLESNADIMEGVSTVFPAFFLLIAALVCITTMTRMVEEERTQIGTLKALGYGNFSIIWKYLAYAGSAAILGCGLGVLVGSSVFPLILWQAYNIILNIRPDIALVIDWPLCLSVVAMYTVVVLAVTWYCCRNLLKEVPAELIRPKPPTSGRKIFLEYLPFWEKFSFLNKVMLRNIFRYRQRLLMMLIGVGGCSALLLTGFGIRDSIMDIVDFQFQDVTRYQIEARLSEGLDKDGQADFREELGRYVDRITFAHQSSMEIEFGSQNRDVIMIAAGSEFENIMDLHDDNQSLSMPKIGEALISIGIADKLGVRAGDTVTLRDPDLNTLTLTISAIYDNYVNNYIIVRPETITAQWGEAPELQMAYFTVSDNQDAHYAASKISAYEGVMNVTVCSDLADQIGSMLGALNLVVITVVVCAVLLAVTVTYNLTNINITERIREIATIKVLGFNDKESAAYVFKENLLLSVMGAGVGLIFGKWLLDFVMSQIKVDIVWMEARLLPESYLWAVLFTMLSAVLVDFVLYFKLDKINMAEALKSVE